MFPISYQQLFFAVNCFEKTNNELNEAGNGLSNESAIKLKGAQNKTILT